MPTPAERFSARFVDDAGFLSTELRPERTGIPGVVLVYPGEFSRAETHLGPRLQVLAGRSLTVEGIADSVPVAFTTPPTVHGVLPEDVTRKIIAFVTRNRSVLLRYWHGDVDTMEVLELLERV